jgi:ribosomal protein L30/L7E
MAKLLVNKLEVKSTVHLIKKRIRALGLRKMGQVVEHDQTPILGMIKS